MKEILKKIIIFILGYIFIGLSYMVIRPIIVVIGVMIFGDSVRVVDNISSIGSIIGVLFGAYFFNKIYNKYTGKNLAFLNFELSFGIPTIKKLGRKIKEWLGRIDKIGYKK